MCTRDPDVCGLDCAGAHLACTLRRIPIYKDGKYNYGPWRCPSMKATSGIYCADGDNCRFSNTDNERIYHPLFYKVRIIYYISKTQSDK